MADETVFDCDPEVVAQWSHLTLDHNPLHVDDEYAARTQFGRPIVQGHLLACLVLDRLGAAGVARGRVSIRFREPVAVGATLRLGLTDDPVTVVVDVEGQPSNPLVVKLPALGP
jgi:acyl dehydratase